VTPSNHPAGITAAAASILVIVAKKAGVELTVEEAVIVVGALASIVSVFTPRVSGA
jgi:hypothetical protein